MDSEYRPSVPVEVAALSPSPVRTTIETPGSGILPLVTLPSMRQRFGLCAPIAAPNMAQAHAAIAARGTAVVISDHDDPVPCASRAGVLRCHRRFIGLPQFGHAAKRTRW